MDRVFKVPSNQSDNITNSNNLLDFDIPQGQFDLSKSHVEVKVLCSGFSPVLGYNDATFNLSGLIDSENGQTITYTPAVALVKHARMVSSTKGRLEEARQVNEMRLQLKNIQQPQSVYLGTNHTDLQSIKSYEQWGGISPLVDVTSENGTGSNKYLEKTVKIPMSEVVNIGKSTFFDTSRLGDCRLSVEVDRTRLSVAQVDPSDDYFTKVNSGLCNGMLKNDAGAGAKTTAVLGNADGTAEKKYDEDYQEHIPYYVGMPVVLPDTNNGGNGTIGAAPIAAEVKTHITNISYDETSGEVTLTFNDSLGTGATLGVFILPGKNADYTSSIVMNQANLVLHQIGQNNMPNEIPNQLNYTVYAVENDTFATNTTALKRQYQLEPECINAFVTLPSISNGIISSKVLEEYRVSINNELTTDRNVPVFNPLYYHKLNMLGLNMNQSIRNVAQKKYLVNSGLNKADQDDGEDRGTFSNISGVFEPMPATQDYKLVEFEINNQAGIPKISIFKELVKSV